MSGATVRRWGVEMHDGSFEWYESREIAVSMVTRRSGLEPTPITSQVDAALDVAEEHFERILAAHLAAVEARLASVREKWESTHDGVLSPRLASRRGRPRPQVVPEDGRASWP